MRLRLIFLGEPMEFWVARMAGGTHFFYRWLDDPDDRGHIASAAPFSRFWNHPDIEAARTELRVLEPQYWRSQV